MDLTFPIAVCATFFVSLLVLLYVIHLRLQVGERAQLALRVGLGVSHLLHQRLQARVPHMHAP